MRLLRLRLLATFSAVVLLVPLREGGTADAPAMAAASARARSTGKPVRVNKLTTSTSITVAEPHGGFVFQESVLPVRVRRGHGWVPVNTSLRGNAGGTFPPAAVPGDTVTFSGGGTRPLAAIGSGTASLQVSWPAASRRRRCPGHRSPTATCCPV